MKTILSIFMGILCLNATAQKIENREVKDFTGIKCDGITQVFLTQANTNTVKVEANKYLINKIETKVKNGVLIIKVQTGKRNFNRDEDSIKIYITMKILNKIELEGASSIQSLNTINTDKFKISAEGAASINLDVNVNEISLTLSGASTTNLKGKTAVLNTNVSGASLLNTLDLEAQNVTIDASGASIAKVFSSKSLTADVSGISVVKYAGNPKNKNTEVSDLSKITEINIKEIDEK